MATPLSPLKLNVRADLFKQLGAMEEAGVPVDQALHLTRVPGANARVATMRMLLSQRASIAEAGLKSGLFTRWDASLLSAAISAGRLAHTYRRLSDYYARRAARAAAIGSRMMLPLAMLVIAIVVQPLPSLVAGTVSLGGFLLKCLLELIALSGAVYLFTGLPHWREPGSSASRDIPLDPVLPRVPLFGSMYERRNVRDCFESLALLLEAGMPILEALPLSVKTIQSQALREQFSQIKPRIDQGASFAQAVGELTFAGHAQAHAMIVAGEASGALPEVLFRYSEAETSEIDRFDDLVAQWMPRVAYAIVLLWIGYGIFRNNPFSPSLPPELR